MCTPISGTIGSIKFIDSKHQLHWTEENCIVSTDRMRLMCLVPAEYKNRPTHVFACLYNARHIQYVCSVRMLSEIKDVELPSFCFNAAQYEAIINVGGTLYCQMYISEKLNVQLNSLHWFLVLDHTIRNELIKDGILIHWHSPVVSEYVCLIDGKREETMSRNTLELALENVLKRHNLAESEARGVGGDEELSVSSYAGVLFKPTWTQMSKLLNEKKHKRISQDDHEEKDDSRLPSPPPSPQESKLWVYDKDMNDVFSYFQNVNNMCYAQGSATDRLYRVPSNSMIRGISETTFESGVDLLDAYVNRTQAMMLRKHNVPNVPNMVVFMSHTLNADNQDIYQYVLSDLATMERFHKRALEKNKVLCWHEVFFTEKTYTRLCLDVDCPLMKDWNWDGVSKNELFSLLASTLNCVLFVVWSNTLNIRLNRQLIDTGIFERENNNSKWSLRIVLKFPFNCVVHSIKSIRSLVVKMVAECIGNKIPYLCYVKHPTEPHIVSHLECDTSTGLLRHKPSTKPKWFEEKTGSPVVTMNTGWTEAVWCSSIDTNVYFNHKSIRMPWCGKLDKSVFKLVWCNTIENQERNWSIGRCLMGTPYTHYELSMIPQLGKSMHFASEEKSLFNPLSTMWKFQTSGVLPPERIDCYKRCAEREFGCTFSVKRQSDPVALLLSTLVSKPCKVCERQHSTKRRICLILTPTTCFLKCFSDQMRRLYMEIDPVTQRVTWKERTAVCRYGDQDD